MTALRRQEDQLEAASPLARSLAAATGSYAPIAALAQQHGTNMAMQGLYANRGGGDAYSNEFMLNGRGCERLPPAFAKRGIKADMWNKDIRDLQAIMSAHYKRNGTNCLITAATCGLYLIKECVSEGLVARVEREINTKLDDMNTCYEKFGVVFNLKGVPGAGWFIRYEA